MNLFITFIVDHVDGVIAAALMSENVAELKRLSQDFRHATEKLHSWAMAVGGCPVLDLGSIGSLEAPADRMTEVPQLAKRFEDETSATLSIGVGMTLAESYSAAKFSSLQGGDQISLYQPEMDDKFQAAESPADSDPLVGLSKADGDDEGGMSQPSKAVGQQKIDQHGADGKFQAKPSEYHKAPPTDEPPQPAADDAGMDLSSSPDDQGQPQPQGQPQEEPVDPRTAVVNALQEIKRQAPVLEQLKQSNPDAFEAIKDVVQAMILMAQGMAAQEPQTESSESEPASEPAESESSESPVSKSEVLHCDDNVMEYLDFAKAEGDPPAPDVLAPEAPPAKVRKPRTKKYAATIATGSSVTNPKQVAVRALIMGGGWAITPTQKSNLKAATPDKPVGKWTLTHEPSGLAAVDHDDSNHLSMVREHLLQAPIDWTQIGHKELLNHEPALRHLAAALTHGGFHGRAAEATQRADKVATTTQKTELEIDKAEHQFFPVGTQVDTGGATYNEGRVKVKGHDPQTGQAGPEKWRHGRSGLVMGKDGAAASARKPGTEK